jgi:hypothetical protein
MDSMQHETVLLPARQLTCCARHHLYVARQHAGPACSFLLVPASQSSQQPHASDMLGE